MIDESARILIVEDEEEIRGLMALHLSRHGYVVTECSSSAEGLTEIRNSHYHLAIVDWMLPGLSGVEMIESIKQVVNPPKVLMVTAKSEPEDIVEGLERGADDYMTKPFDLSVFIARTKALLRRKENHQEKSTQKIQVLGLSVDPKSYEVILEGNRLHLTPSEYKLLVSIVLSQGQVLTRNQLIDQVQGEGVNVTGRTIDTHVFGLRKKLGSWSENIETIRGVGYRLRNE
jgi:two-component system, OmpR family, phosphate regulon response regulator PhoB